MKKIYTILAIILLAVMTGCGGGSNQSDDFITVDVTKRYPMKELILQDILDVEYIPLESTEDFITMANIQAIGKEFIITRNLFPGDGDNVFFGRTGKGLRTINRKGQGPGEYIDVGGVMGVVLDEDNNEFYVNDGGQRKIFVYDLWGNFKRSFSYKEGPFFSYSYIFIFDRDHLICHSADIHTGPLRFPDREYSRNEFTIISKQDGSVTKEIEIPYKEGKPMSMSVVVNGRTINSLPARDWRLNPYHESWILAEVSSDTIYRYFPDHSMIPFIVRTPSIQSMDPEVFLIPSMLTDRYYFMQSIKKALPDTETREFPRTELMYDTQEKAIFETVVYNDDFSNQRRVPMWYIYGETFLINSKEIVFAERLEAFELVKAYKEGKLKGKLKEIAAELDEEDNAVIMIAKNKK